MSNAYARAEQIRTESPNRIERKIITYMMLDKTYTEIMAILSQDGVQLFANPAGQVWNNLRERIPEFFATYNARQREIYSRMNFIPTPGISLSESEALLAPGPQVNWRPSTQNMPHTVPSTVPPRTHQGSSSTGGSSDVLERNNISSNLAIRHGANTTQNLPGGNVDNSRLLGAVPGWFSSSVRTDFLESYGAGLAPGQGVNLQPAAIQTIPNTRATIVPEWRPQGPGNMGGPSDVREPNTSFSVATSHGADISQNLSGGNTVGFSGFNMLESYSGSSISRAANAYSQARVQHQDDSDGSSDLQTQTHKKPKRARNRTRIASYLRNLNKASYKISKSTRKPFRVPDKPWSYIEQQKGLSRVRVICRSPP